jgi:hypothetical protein
MEKMWTNYEMHKNELRKKKDHSIGFSQKRDFAYLLLANEILNYSNWG